MQRIYDVPKSKKLDTREFFELRENTPQEQLEAKPAYKIPSSSNLLNNAAIASAGSTSTKSYKPATQAYPPEDLRDFKTSQQYISPRGLHCIVIADHILDCPICSRFYRNYTPFYNIIIMILLMMLIFLFIRCQKLTLLSTPRSYAPPPSPAS